MTDETMPAATEVTPVRLGPPAHDDPASASAVSPAASVAGATGTAASGGLVAGAGSATIELSSTSPESPEVSIDGPVPLERVDPAQVTELWTLAHAVTLSETAAEEIVLVAVGGTPEGTPTDRLRETVRLCERPPRRVAGAAAHAGGAEDVELDGLVGEPVSADGASPGAAPTAGADLALRTAWLHLPVPERSMVVLFDRQGVGTEECGVVLGVGTDEARALRARAWASLEALGPPGAPDADRRLVALFGRLEAMPLPPSLRDLTLDEARARYTADRRARLLPPVAALVVLVLVLGVTMFIVGRRTGPARVVAAGPDTTVTTVSTLIATTSSTEASTTEAPSGTFGPPRNEVVPEPAPSPPPTTAAKTTTTSRGAGAAASPVTAPDTAVPADTTPATDPPPSTAPPLTFGPVDFGAMPTGAVPAGWSALSGSWSIGGTGAVTGLRTTTPGHLRYAAPGADTWTDLTATMVVVIGQSGGSVGVTARDLGAASFIACKLNSSGALELQITGGNAVDKSAPVVVQTETPTTITLTVRGSTATCASSGATLTANVGLMPNGSIGAVATGDVAVVRLGATG